jgi:hypothetical protein
MEAASSAALRDGVSVVALVASAAGLDAVRRVVGALSQRFAAAVVVLTHQAPERASSSSCWAGAPGFRSSRQGREAPCGRRGDGRSAGQAPAGHARHALRVDRVGRGAPSRPSADLLLTTLATAAGPRPSRWCSPGPPAPARDARRTARSSRDPALPAPRPRRGQTMPMPLRQPLPPTGRQQERLRAITSDEAMLGVVLNPPDDKTPFATASYERSSAARTESQMR